MTASDLEHVERNAQKAVSSDGGALRGAIDFLRADSASCWVANSDRTCYLHAAEKGPGWGRSFHFYIQGVDIKLVVFDGLRQREKPVLLECAPALFSPDVMKELRCALVVYYGWHALHALKSAPD